MRWKDVGTVVCILCCVNSGAVFGYFQNQEYPEFSWSIDAAPQYSYEEQLARYERIASYDDEYVDARRLELLEELRERAAQSLQSRVKQRACICHFCTFERQCLCARTSSLYQGIVIYFVTGRF